MKRPKTFRIEKHVKKYLQDCLKELGCWQYWPVSNGMGRHGIPDCLGCYKGRFFSVETKAPGKRGNENRGASALQMKELRSIADNGGLAWICDGPEEVEAIVNYLKEI